MNTSKFIKLSLSMVFVAIIGGSCSKADSEPVTTLTDTQSNVNNGILLDQGLSDAGLRHMHLVLNNQTFDTYTTSGEISVNKAILSIVFYTDEDGHVPSGNYKYAASPDEGPFTFGNATLNSISNNYSVSSPINTITGGNISVSNSGLQYDIRFQCTLSTGEAFRSQFIGKMAYFDN